MIPTTFTIELTEEQYMQIALKYGRKDRTEEYGDKAQTAVAFTQRWIKEMILGPSLSLEIMTGDSEKEEERRRRQIQSLISIQ